MILLAIMTICACLEIGVLNASTTAEKELEDILDSLPAKVDQANSMPSVFPDEVEQVACKSSQMRKFMSDKLTELEKTKADTHTFLETPGMESDEVLVGNRFVLRLRKGQKLYEELHNVARVKDGFLKKAADFAKNGLFICLPVNSIFIKDDSSGCSPKDHTANLFVMPKARGVKLSDALKETHDLEHMTKVFYRVGYTLGVFQQTFLQDHETHLSTAKHGDMAIWNMFYEIGEENPLIHWIDCTHMYLERENLLSDLGYLIAGLEIDAFRRVPRYWIGCFQRQILDGYCEAITPAIVSRLYETLSKSLKDESWLLGEKISRIINGDAEKLLKFVRAHFKMFLGA